IATNAKGESLGPPLLKPSLAVTISRSSAGLRPYSFRASFEVVQAVHLLYLSENTKSSSVRFPYCCLSLPFSSFHEPLNWSLFIYCLYVFPSICGLPSQVFKGFP